jgi:Kdo2-lipid IVA lauroyltransferase/acyltransferase
MFGFLGVTVLRVFFWGFSKISQSARIRIFAALMRCMMRIVPRLRRTAWTNLRIAFPQISDQECRDLLDRNCVEIGRLLADAVRLSDLDREWALSHVECPALERYQARLREGKGVLIATGHLGSFELLGHAIGLLGHPLSAVARRFRNPRLDAWWRGMREARGNTIIDRTGAFKVIARTIAAGRSVAILFDQNVTQNHAVFVPFFGRLAATTKSIALAAIRERAPVFVASIRYKGNDSYVIDGVECDFSQYYDDDESSLDHKVAAITTQLNSEYEAMIRRFPEGWFWFHRRWKTQPSAESI